MDNKSGKVKRRRRGVLSQQEMIYCEEKAKCGSSSEAYRIAFPGEAEKNRIETVKQRIYRLDSDPKIQACLAYIQERFAKRTEKKYSGLKELLIDKMVSAIEAITQDDPRAMVGCVQMVKQISTMLGYDAATEVTVRNGGVTPDYRCPPSVEALSDEELSGIVLGKN